MSDKTHTLARGRRLSEDEFYARTGEFWDSEYLGGAAVVREPASSRHEDICVFLLTLLRMFLDERGGGVVLGSRLPMRLDEKWSPEPDVLVVREERRHLLRTQRLEGPADLVIEIGSPASTRTDLRRKLPRYRQAGVGEIWLVDPFACSVRVEVRETAAGYRSREQTTGRLASALIPGFWVDLSWLWQDPLPPTPSCLRQILA